MGRRRLVVGSLAIAAGALACQLLANIEEVPKFDRPDDAEPAAPPDLCAHDDVPPPTGRNDAPDVPGGVYYLAVETFDLLASREDGTPAGYDLDGICTCDGRVGSRADGGASCRSTEVFCDVDGGIDNELQQIVQIYDESLPTQKLSAGLDLNVRVQDGSQTVLVYLAGYNGTPNDDDVSVGFFISNGILDPGGCGSEEDRTFGIEAPDGSDAGSYYRPRWCGQDRWTYDSATTFAGPLGPKEGVTPRLSHRGYVTDGRLVFRGAALDIFLGATRVRLTSTRMSGRLVPENGGFALEDAVFGGRVTAAAFIEVAARVRSTTGSDDAGNRAFSPLCASDNIPGRFALDSIKATICERLDVAQNESVDLAGEDCGALSVGFRVRARPVAIGSERSDAPGTLEELGCGDLVDAGYFTCPPKR